MNARVDCECRLKRVVDFLLRIRRHESLRKVGPGPSQIHCHLDPQGIIWQQRHIFRPGIGQEIDNGRKVLRSRRNAGYVKISQINRDLG